MSLGGAGSRGTLTLTPPGSVVVAVFPTCGKDDTSSKDTASDDKSDDNDGCDGCDGVGVGAAADDDSSSAAP